MKNLPATGHSSITSGDSARHALVRGAGQVARLLESTLGPSTGPSLVATAIPGGPPEAIGRGGLLNRRMTGLPDPFESIGAMLVRKYVSEMDEACGDGTATTAIIAFRLLSELVRSVNSGLDPHQLKAQLELAILPVIEAIRTQSRMIDDRNVLEHVIAGSIPDARIAATIAEALDALGHNGTIRVLDGAQPGVTSEYIEGASWASRCASRYMLPVDDSVSRLVDARILVSDQPIDTVEQIIPALEVLLKAGERSILIVAPAITTSPLGLLLKNSECQVLTGALAVTPIGRPDRQAELLHDVATICGARLISQTTMDRIEDVSLDDLGFARQVWVTSSMFGFLNPGGESRERRKRIRTLTLVESALGKEATTDRQWLQTRIGNLSGASAEIRVGAATEIERSELKRQVEAVISTGRIALRHGFVPGGGRALLNAIPATESAETDVQHSVACALQSALSAPAMAIACNAGREGTAAISESGRQHPDMVYDVVASEWRDAWSSGLLDATGVLTSAVEISSRLVGEAITIDQLIVRRSKR